MTISQIKMDLCNHIGDNVVIKYNLGRNKYEKYKVKIKELYDYVFLVEGKHNDVKSFTYSDIITKTIKIDY